MSFFSSLFGGTFESNFTDAQRYFEQKNFGDAKLSYERALKKADGTVSANQQETARARIEECRRLLAEGRVRNAQEYLDAGDVDLARLELDNALEISDAPEIVEKVQLMRDRIEAAIARDLADGGDEMSEDELLAVIAGTWSAPRADEYNQFPDDFFKAMIAAHDGDHAAANACIDQLIADHDQSFPLCFIYFEKGFQSFALRDLKSAEAAFEKFIEAVEDDPEAGEERLIAHTLLARIYEQTDRLDQAEAELKRAVKVAPKSHVPVMNLGIFLRDRQQYERAMKAFENAMSLMGSHHPDPRVFKELGITCALLDRRDEAIGWFETVVKQSTIAGSHDQIDPEAGVALAKLYEAKGRQSDACDIFRHLATGHDRSNHFVYNVESARLLIATGGAPEAIRGYVTRALELAKDDAQKDLVAQLEKSQKTP